MQDNNRSESQDSTKEGPVVYQPQSFVGELWAFLRVRKKFWLAPIVIIMLMLGGLLVVGQGSALAPFIYTLF